MLLTYLSDVSDLALKRPVIDQNLGSERHSLSKLSVGRCNTRAVSFDGRIDHDLELLAGLKLNWLAFLQGAGQN